MSLSLCQQRKTMSHPVIAWNTGKALLLSGPSICASVCAGIYLKVLPVPNAIHISLPSSQEADVTASTTTCVNCSNRDFRIALHHSIFQVKHHSCVCFLVRAWGKYRFISCDYITLHFPLYLLFPYHCRSTSFDSLRSQTTLSYFLQFVETRSTFQE